MRELFRRSEQKGRHGGRLSLGYYHPKRDETRNIDLGPEHDFSSHAADAFGLTAISYEKPSKSASFWRTIELMSRCDGMRMEDINARG